MLSCETWEIFENNFFTELLRWLLLQLYTRRHFCSFNNLSSVYTRMKNILEIHLLFILSFIKIRLSRFQHHNLNKNHPQSVKKWNRMKLSAAHSEFCQTSLEVTFCEIHANAFFHIRNAFFQISLSVA